jgi:hypothetical protein
LGVGRHQWLASIRNTKCDRNFFQGGTNMDEKTFFEYDDVKVTNARFISGSQTYAMSNVTSVKAFEEKPSRLWGIVVLLIGLAIASNNAAVGLIIAASAGSMPFSVEVDITGNGG